MSSRPNKAAAAKGKPGGADKKESKALKGPIITPQALGILFGLILVIGIPVFYSNVIKKQQEEIASIKSQIAAKESEISTYRKKGAKRDEADRLNNALKQKLSTLDYLFLEDQLSLVPFYEQTFLPLLTNSNLQFTEDSKLEAPAYTFRVNMAMRPFETIPGSVLFEDPAALFKIAYEPEQGGVPVEVPLDTRPSAFLEPYDIKLSGMAGTYNDVKNFIKDVQSRNNDKLITVHCVKNVKDKNAYGFRTQTQWTLQFTVYFMNPEQAASGDSPPGAPGSKSC
jgi:hypothetical protein